MQVTSHESHLNNNVNNRGKISNYSKKSDLSIKTCSLRNLELSLRNKACLSDMACLVLVQYVCECVCVCVCVGCVYESV